MSTIAIGTGTGVGGTQHARGIRLTRLIEEIGSVDADDMRVYLAGAELDGHGIARELGLCELGQAWAGLEDGNEV